MLSAVTTKVTNETHFAKSWMIFMECTHVQRKQFHQVIILTLYNINKAVFFFPVTHNFTVDNDYGDGVPGENTGT